MDPAANAVFDFNLIELSENLAPNKTSTYETHIAEMEAENQEKVKLEGGILMFVGAPAVKRQKQRTSALVRSARGRFDECAREAPGSRGRSHLVGREREG